MRKISTYLLALVFLFSAFAVFAQEKSMKGANERALERASDEAIFNRVSDWFATIGKSKEKKEEIITQRQLEREKKRAEKQATKIKRKAEKKAIKVKRKAEKESMKVKANSKKEAPQKKKMLDMNMGTKE